MGDSGGDEPRPGPPIVFSMGDPHGIGPEVVLKALHALPRQEKPPLLFGDPDYLQNLARDLGLSLAPGQVQVLPVGECVYPPRWGKVDAAAGAFALESLRKAVGHCRDHGLPLLVTPPVSKMSLRLAGCTSPGQTEIIGSFFPGHRPVMAFLSERLKLVLVTVHIPLRQVPALLEGGEIVRRTELFRTALQRIGILRPRLAICGLNPHASEDGLFGHEEAEILAPALDLLNRKHGPGTISGPHPADTLFRRALAGEFDGIVALYHDQGLIPLKLVSFESAVNVSLGLPLVRTSPDHGTAFDIAGKGVADENSMLSAIHWGLQLRSQPARAR